MKKDGGPTQTITVSEWEQAFREAVAGQNEEGQTFEELLALTGFGMSKLRRILRHLSQAGQLIVGHKQGMSISGRPFKHPVYRLVKQKGKK